MHRWLTTGGAMATETRCCWRLLRVPWSTNTGDVGRAIRDKVAICILTE